MQNIWLRLRTETPADYRAVEELTREAFWNHFGPGCNEHYLAHLLRDEDCFIRELDFVAEAEGKIVGSIMYTEAVLAGDDQANYPVLTFGPLAVLPAFQGRGVGGALVEHTKQLAAKQGHHAILIYGDPAYYRRFGFVPAETFGIGSSDDFFADALQALELRPGALSGCAGRFVEAPAFDVDQKRADLFDRLFPPKEKCAGLPSQERFLQLVKMRRPRK